MSCQGVKAGGLVKNVSTVDESTEGCLSYLLCIMQL